MNARPAESPNPPAPIFDSTHPRPNLLLGIYCAPPGDQTPSTDIYVCLTLDVKKLARVLLTGRPHAPLPNDLPVEELQCREVPPLRPSSADTDQRYRCWHLEKALDSTFNQEVAIEVAPDVSLASGPRVQYNGTWEKGKRGWHLEACPPGPCLEVSRASTTLSYKLLARQLLYGATNVWAIRQSFRWLARCDPDAALTLLFQDRLVPEIGEHPACLWKSKLRDRDLAPLLGQGKESTRRQALRWLGRRLPLQGGSSVG